MRNSKSCRGKLAESQATKKPIPPPDIPLAPPKLQVKPIVVAGIPAMQPVSDTMPSINSIDTTSIVQTVSDDNHHTVMSLGQIRNLDTLQTLPTMNPLITISSISGTTMSDSTIQTIIPLIESEQKDINRFY